LHIHDGRHLGANAVESQENGTETHLFLFRCTRHRSGLGILHIRCGPRRYLDKPDQIM